MNVSGKEKEGRREGELNEKIYSFFPPALSEVMSATNEFPSRVLLP